MNRTVILLSVVSIVALGLTAAASANITLPSLGGYEGYVYFKFTSYNMATSYGTEPGSFTLGIDNVNDLPQLGYYGAGASGDVYYDRDGNSSLDSMFNDSLMEDGWGIFRITEIRAANSANTLLWQDDGKDGVEMLGIFYGMVDNAVYAYPTRFGGQSEIQSQDVQYAIYINPAGSFAAANTGSLTGAGQGSYGRFGFDQYNGITNVAGGDLLLSGFSVAGGTSGFTNGDDVTDADVQFMSKLFPNASDNSVGGSYNTRISLTGGLWYDNFYLGDPDAADMSLQGTFILNDNADKFVNPVGNWNVQGNDPIRGYYTNVPEPMTMGLLALGGLALLRRRK